MKSQTDLKAALAVKDEDLDTSEEPKMSLDEFWSHAMPFVEVMDQRKVAVTIRMEPALLEFYKQGGPGYQKRIRQALRAYAARIK